MTAHISVYGGIGVKSSLCCHSNRGIEGSEVICVTEINVHDVASKSIDDDEWR